MATSPNRVDSGNVGTISAAIGASADERMQRTERRLIDAALAVNEASSLAEALAVLVDTAKELVAADRVSLLEWEADFDGARVLAGTGLHDINGVEVPATPAMGDLVCASHAFVAEGLLLVGLPDEMREAIAKFGTLLCVPFVVDGAPAFSFQAGWLQPIDDDRRDAAISKLRLLARLTRIAFRAEYERDAVRAERRLRAVIEATPNGLIVRSDDGAIVNSAARDLLAAVDNPPVDIGLRELDGTPVPATETPLVRAKRTGDLQGFTLRVTRYDGVERIHQGSVAPVLDDDGHVFATVTSFSDVTEAHEERFRTQQFLAQLFNALPSAVSVSKPGSGEVVSVNRAFLDMVGYDADEVLGATHPYPWWADSTPYAELADGQSEPVTCERLFRRKDGTLVPAAVTRSIVRNEDGAPETIVAVIDDLSERREFERRLIQSGKLASIGELAAGVAHEINNPLFAILGLVEFLLLDAEEGTKAQERLVVIQSTALEIKEIVRALLDFAREGSDERATVSLSCVVAQTVELIRRTNSAKQIEILETYGDDELLVEGSPNQLKQIFVNLISNAKLAMPGGGTIAVSVVREAESACVEVRDDGPGIAPEVLERIFEPFFTTRRDSGGTGLGLSVSLGIAEAHGGSLTVESEAGGGSTFRVRLPLAQGEDA